MQRVLSYHDNYLVLEQYLILSERTQTACVLLPVLCPQQDVRRPLLDVRHLAPPFLRSFHPPLSPQIVRLDNIGQK